MQPHLPSPPASFTGMHSAFRVLHTTGSAVCPGIAKTSVGQHLSAELHARLEAARTTQERDEAVHGVADALVSEGCIA